MIFTGLFAYKLVFMAELLFSEFLFCFRLKRREFYALRIAIALLVDAFVALIFPIPTYNALYTSFMFLMMFLVTFGTMTLCYKEHWGNILFCCIAGYTIQHLAYEAYNLLCVLLGIGDITLGFYGNSGAFDLGINPLALIVYLAVYFPLYLFAYFFFSRQIRKGELQIKNIPLFGLSVLIILFDIVMNATIVYRVNGMSDADAWFIRCMAGLYNIFCCALSIIIQFSLSTRQYLRDELQLEKRLRREEQEQYDRLKENINLINMKCHDIKHQIVSIGQRSAVSSEYLSEMEEVISIYDSNIKTGNDTLDIILSEKSLRCSQSGIRFSCIADASGLGRMRESDIYSLFGNLIDNAIESVMQLDLEQRVVGVQVRRREKQLLINIYNTFAGQLVFKGGFPVSTKGDEFNHGYGIKSVKYICDKYGGTLSIHPHENIFDVTILLPLE